MPFSDPALDPVVRAAYRRGLVPYGHDSNASFIARVVTELDDLSPPEIADLVNLAQALREAGLHSYEGEDIRAFISRALKSGFRSITEDIFSGRLEKRLLASSRPEPRSASTKRGVAVVAGGILAAVLAALL